MRPLNIEKSILERILVNISHISALLQTMTPESFMQDLKDFNAMCLEFIQIGEKVHQLPEEFIDKYPEVPWHELYGLRNRIVHGYEKVNKSVIWATITKDVSEIEKQIIQIIEKIS